MEGFDPTTSFGLEASERYGDETASVAHTVVLVEGISDQRALEALAIRRGRLLDAEGVSVMPIGGAQEVGRTLERVLRPPRAGREGGRPL